MAKQKRKKTSKRRGKAKVRKTTARPKAAKAAKRTARKATAKKVAKRAVGKTKAKKRSAQKKRAPRPTKLPEPPPELTEETVLDIVEVPAPGVVVVTEIEAVEITKPPEDDGGSD